MKKLFLLIISTISLPIDIIGMDTSPIAHLTFLVARSCNNPADDTHIDAIAQHIKDNRVDINNLNCWDKDKKYSFLEFAIFKQHRKLIRYALAHHAYITPEIITMLQWHAWDAYFYYHDMFNELTRTYPYISTLPTKENVTLMNSYLTYRDWCNIQFLAKQYYKQQQWIAALAHIAAGKYKQTNPQKRKQPETPWNDLEFVPCKKKRRY